MLQVSVIVLITIVYQSHEQMDRFLKKKIKMDGKVFESVYYLPSSESTNAPSRLPRVVPLLWTQHCYFAIR